MLVKSVNFVFVYGGKSVVNAVYANRFSGSLVSLVLVVLCSSGSLVLLVYGFCGSKAWGSCASLVLCFSGPLVLWFL